MTRASHELITPGASAQSMRRVVAGMICMLGLALAVVVGLKLVEARHINTLLGHSEDNLSWAVHQLEAEQLRFELALLGAEQGDAAALQEAALRYETFASRRNVLATGVFHRKLNALPAYGAVMTAFNQLLTTHDPMMADGLQPGEVAHLLTAVTAIRGPVHDLVLAENAVLNGVQGESRAHVAMVRNISLATLSVLGIVLLCFAVYALVVLRRAHNVELALSRSEHVLRDALREAQGASAAKSVFLANMSHELRTPLNAVIGFAEFLEISTAGRLDERQRGYLADIRSSGRHLLEILSSILELSKLEAGKVDLQVDQVPAKSLLGECIRMLTPRAERSGIVIVAAGLDGLPPIQGDATRLRQIFLNLLSNAVKYSSEGATVHVRGSAGDGFVTVQIADEGIGMHGADIETALRPFERLRNAETASQEGVGLGLTITKTLIDIHNGRLEIESEIGRGTIVTVHLPAGCERAAIAEPLPTAAIKARPLEILAAS